MRQWAKRVGGGAISILSLWKVVDLVWGVPGRIDDSAAWRIWLDGMNPSDIIYPAGLVFGIFLGTSEWWWPWIASIRPRSYGSTPLSVQPTSGISVGEIDNELDRFRACLPHIERCRKLVKPFAGPLGSIDMALQLLSDGGSRIQELLRELGYLSRDLKTLGIRCPIVYGGNDESDSTFRNRLRIWAMHLTDLAVMTRNDDLAGARQIIPIGMATQPNSDTE